MYKDKNNNLIGRGEDVAVELLTKLFPNFEIKRQVKFKSLLNGEWLDTVTDRQEKETLDIVIYAEPIIVVRVQDPRHTGRILAQRDLVQKKTLEWNGVKVIDLYHYDCVNIMKDLNNDESLRELKDAFKQAGLTI